VSGSHRGEFTKLDKMQLRSEFTGAVTVASSIISLCGPATGWASDTDRTFATALTGTMFSGVDTPVYLYVASTGRIIFGLCFVRRRINLDIETEV